MRPIAQTQDYLSAPLNELLGTPANVRVIRVLADEVSGPIGAPEAADLTGLTETGARQALRRLVKTGFVEEVGGGRAQRFRLRESDPLSDQIRELFRAEKDRHHLFLSQLRQVFGSFAEIRSAWIDDPPEKAGQPLHIGVLAETQALTYLGRELRQRIVGLEESFDTTIELHLFSRADIPDVNWSDVTLVAGHPQEWNRSRGDDSNHRARTERATRISEALAQALDKDPSLIRRAQRHLDMLLQQDQGPAFHDLQEWRNILAHYSRTRLKEFLIADTPRAQRLRQSSPFFAILSPQELEELLASLRDDE